MVDDGWTDDDGRRRTDDRPWLYYKLTNESKGSGELKSNYNVKTIAVHTVRTIQTQNTDCFSYLIKGKFSIPLDKNGICFRKNNNFAYSNEYPQHMFL